MRIIKHNLISGVDDIDIITGEMINKELRAEIFRDGKIVLSPTEITTAQTYPYITRGNISDAIKSSYGYLFVPVGYEMNAFKCRLEERMSALRNDLCAKGYFVASYKCIMCSQHTCLKVLNDKYIPWNFEIASDRNTLRVNNTWQITPVNKCLTKVTSANLYDAIAQNICSIFYDADDICSLAHNSIVFDFCRVYFCGGEKLLSGRQISPNKLVTIFVEGPPLLIELSRHWREVVINMGYDTSTSFLRNIDVRKVIQIEYNTLNCNLMVSMDLICGLCQSPLWGDNYVINVVKRARITDKYMFVCVLCLHAQINEHIEEQQTKIYKVTISRDISHIIDMLYGDDVRRDIVMEANKGITPKTYINSAVGITAPYLLIGSKYIGISEDKHITDMFAAGFGLHDDCIDRNICMVGYIKR